VVAVKYEPEAVRFQFENKPVFYRVAALVFRAKGSYRKTTVRVRFSELLSDPPDYANNFLAPFSRQIFQAALK